MTTSDMSKEVKVVVNGELLADSTASRKLFPPKVEKQTVSPTVSLFLPPEDDIGSIPSEDNEESGDPEQG